MRIDVTFAVILSLCFQGAFAREPLIDSPVDTPVRRDFLSPKQIIGASNAALRGDTKSAILLSNYYMYVENDIVESDFWIQLAAENSDCKAMMEYSHRVEHHAYLNTPKRRETWRNRYEAVCIKSKR